MSRITTLCRRTVRSRTVPHTCMLVVLACLSSSAMPADSLRSTADTVVQQDSLPVYHLGDVVLVRGQKDVPVSAVSEITGPSMKTQGSGSVTNALSGVPGVIVTAGSKGESRIQLRGFQSQQTLVLYDGRPIALPYYGDLDLTTIPLSNISRISVVKGPAPALYGANSMGGVVNIVSQRVIGNPIREARVSMAENAGYDVLLNYGAAADQLDWWLSAGRSSSDGYDLSDDFEANALEDGELRYNSDYRHFNLDGKLNYTLNNGTIVSLSAGVYDAVRGLPTGSDRAQYQRYPLWQRWYTDIGADGWLGTRLYWKGKVYYDDCQNRLKRYRDSAMTEANLVFDSYHDSYDIGGVFSATANLSRRMQNATSVSFRRDVIKRQGDVDEPWIENNTTTASFGDQLEYVIARDVRAEIGAGYSLMTSNPDKTSTDAFDLYGGITYSPRIWLDLHLSASRVTRFPTLNQLYASTSGNPDLEPERAVKFEIGYRTQILKRLTVSQAYFRNDVKDLIDRKDRDSRYENLERVDLSGLETGVSLDGRRAGASVSYVYLHALENNVESDTTTTARRSHSPRHKIDYQVLLRTDYGLGLSHTGQAIIDRVDPDKAEMQNYFLVHVKATYRVITSLELFVNVRNLFDVNYEEELYFPMPGRVVSAGVEAKF